MCFPSMQGPAPLREIEGIEEKKKVEGEIVEEELQRQGYEIGHVGQAEVVGRLVGMNIKGQRGYGEILGVIRGGAHRDGWWLNE